MQRLFSHDQDPDRTRGSMESPNETLWSVLAGLVTRL
jgi:hypothetical protein